MKITNSMTGKKEEFVPLNSGEVNMYACGITVYDLSHIGHARQAMVYAMMADYFRYKGYKVKYVRNYTDVDDKIIKRANERNKNALEFSQEMIEENEKDMTNLHVTDADVKPKASEYIKEIIDFVQKLIDNGHAYATSKGDVYFSIKTFPEYGKLSHRNVDDMLEGVRIELEEGKKDPADFALWKSAKPGEISWDSPWGKGRPGWHIECSAMILKNFGETIDIHGGGRDLIFPHHENEIAQSEALVNKPFVKYWSHCGLIKINGEKMSKSLGNSLTIREMLEKYDYEAIKYLMFSKDYTSDIDISDNDFMISERHMYYFYTTIRDMEKFIKENNGNSDGEVFDNDVLNTIVSKFENAMEDDFNTTVAIANLHTIFKYVNNIMKNPKAEEIQIVANSLDKILKDVRSVYYIVGLFTHEPDEFISKLRSKYFSNLNVSENEINELVEKRIGAKKNKDYELADKIREDLERKGIILNDSKDGTSWDIKELYGA